MSNNFILLKQNWPMIYEYATSAEQHAIHQPEIAYIHMRCFIELLTNELYQKLNLDASTQHSLFKQLDYPEFKQYVPTHMMTRLHTLRMLGNKAAHGKSIEQNIIDALNNLHCISAWFYTVMTDDHHPWPVYQFDSSEAEQAITEFNLSENPNLSTPEYNIFIDIDDSVVQQIKNRLNQCFDQFNNIQSHPQLSITDAFVEYELTQGQKHLVEKLNHFLKYNDEQVFLLKGYAGTGKTFITKGLTEYFKSIGRNYVLAAPTGKAAKVIEQKTGSQASTIHKAIYAINDIKQYKEEVEGSETYKFYANLAPNDDAVDTVYIIDEASMLSDQYQESEFFRFGSGYLLRDLLQYINLDHNDHQKKIIFIGDNAQLPPVGMKLSPALSEHYLAKEYGLNLLAYELKEVVRQKSESGVLHHASQLRQAMEKNIFNQLVIENHFEDVHCLKYDEFMSSYLAVSNGKMSADTIVLAQSNADVAAFNKRIREHFFPKQIQLQPRDKIIVVNNYYHPASGQMVANGEFGMVKQVYGSQEIRPVTIRRKNKNTEQVEEISIDLIFRDVQLVLKDLEGNPYEIDSKIVVNLLDSDHANLSSDESKAIYVDFCIRHPSLKPNSTEFKETLKHDPYFNALKIKYGYAITCHKAQGSEWNHVFVKCKIHTNTLSASYFRWFYTAITRTSAQLHLIDPPHVPLGSGLKSVMPHQTLDLAVMSQPPQQRLLSITQDRERYKDRIKALGIPERNAFLNAIFQKVSDLISQSDFKIIDIKHQQYQEAYYFLIEQENIRMDIGYNAKQQISYIRKNSISEHSTALENLLASLRQKNSLSITIPAVQMNNFAFSQAFLQDFHQRLVDLCRKQEIQITQLKQNQWCQNYTFSKGSDVAVFDIWYNSKNKFTKYQPVMPKSNSVVLIKNIESLLTQGLSS